jgi:hypothetical protein
LAGRDDKGELELEAAHATALAIIQHRRSSVVFHVSVTMASVVTSRPATDAAFCRAVRTTLVRLTMPAWS